MSACAVFCQWHEAAAYWLQRQELAAIRTHWDLLQRIHAVAWKHCRCGLWDRLSETLKDRPWAP